jgi:hypothetical protein
MSLLSGISSRFLHRMSFMLLPVVPLLVGCGASSVQSPSSPSSPSPSNVNAVSVSGNEILIDGSPGSLFGWTFVGINDTTACASSYYSIPWGYWQNYATEELNWAKSLGANTIRFQVALDELYEPASQGFDAGYIANYITTVANAVALARSKAFAVIVSMQWESGTSGTSVCDNDNPKHYGASLTGVPATDNAAAAWQALLDSNAWTNNTSMGGTAMNFLTDSGVLLEIYNEPVLGTIGGAASDWQAWQSGLQPLVGAIRGVGAKNVLIVPGLHGERILDARAYGGQSVASYLLTDSENQVIYAVHPYPFVSSGAGYNIGYFNTADFNNYFGNVAQTLTAPVMVTEWLTSGGDSTMCWDETTPKQPLPAPLNYSETSSVDIKNVFINWLAKAGPGSTPMSITGTAFEEGGYWLQNPSVDLAGGNLYPTNFGNLNDSTFQCAVESIADGDGRGSAYPGPGQDLSGYFLKYPQP